MQFHTRLMRKSHCYSSWANLVTFLLHNLTSFISILSTNHLNPSRSYKFPPSKKFPHIKVVYSFCFLYSALFNLEYFTCLKAPATLHNSQKLYDSFYERVHLCFYVVVVWLLYNYDSMLWSLLVAFYLPQMQRTYGHVSIIRSFYWHFL
jgi:hypothetical protein